MYLPLSQRHPDKTSRFIRIGAVGGPAQRVCEPMEMAGRPPLAQYDTSARNLTHYCS